MPCLPTFRAAATRNTEADSLIVVVRHCRLGTKLAPFMAGCRTGGRFSIRLAITGYFPKGLFELPQNHHKLRQTPDEGFFPMGVPCFRFDLQPPPLRPAPTSPR